MRAFDDTAARYASSLVSVGAALCLGIVLDAAAQVAPFPLFLLGVLFCAWVGGLGPGLAATLLSAAAIDYFFLTPIYQLDIARANAVLDLAVFALVAVAISSLSARLSEANRRAAADRAVAEATWDQLQAIIDATEEGLIVFDEHGRVQFVNRWLDAWFHVHLGGVPRTAGALARAVVAGSKRPPAALFPAELALYGLRSTEVLAVASRDAGPRRLRWHAVPIRNRRGRVGGAVAVCRDVTEAPDPLLARWMEATLPVAALSAEQSSN